jgi:hypothetical protein
VSVGATGGAHISHRGLTSYSSFAMAAVSGGGDAQRGGVLEKVALDRRGAGVGGVRQSAECRAGRERASTYVVRGRWSGCLLPRQSNRGDSCGRCAKSRTALAPSPLSAALVYSSWSSLNTASASRRSPSRLDCLTVRELELKPTARCESGNRLQSRSAPPRER